LGACTGLSAPTSAGSLSLSTSSSLSGATALVPLGSATRLTPFCVCSLSQLSTPFRSDSHCEHLAADAGYGCVPCESAGTECISSHRLL
jgi:hypothetical protein